MQHKTSRYLIIIILFFSVSLHANESSPFLTLGIEKGLSNNAVRAIYKDSRGFMWFGTHDGLNRYDGYEFKIFRNILGDKNSLPHNYIYTISEDKHHNLWIGTGQGVGIYSPISNRFEGLFFLTFSDHMRHELKSQINKIQVLRNGEMIVATNGSGLVVRAIDQKIGAQIPFKKIKGPDAVNYNVIDISIAKDNTVYLLVEGVGLCVYDQKSKQISVKENLSETTKCMKIVDNDNLLISSGKGLMRLNIISHKREMISGNSAPPINAALISTMHLDKQQQLWLGTNAEGLKIRPDINRNKFLRPLSGAIQNQLILAIYEDEAGRKWIGTSKDGVIILDAKSAKFKTISSNPLLKTSLVSNFVSSFYEDSSGKLWIGTDAGGISIWNRSQNVFENIKFDPQNTRSLSSNAISAIKEDHFGDIWVATYGGGINKAHDDKKGFKRYRCYNKFTDFENENVWQLLEGHDGTLWATTFSHGTLYFLNREKDQFEVFDKNFMENLLAIKEDLNYTLWGGNASSLIKIDRKTKKHEYFDIGKPVRVIFEDHLGNFWLGSEGGGLVLFDRKKRKIVKRFSTLDGLSNNSVISILETNGVLWLSTFSGLSKFDIKKQTFLNYYQDDGLQSNQFLDNASLKLKSGELVLGGVKGFSIFHPDSSKLTSVAAPIVLTGIRINNMAISPDHAAVTGLNDGLIEKIEIPYNEALAIDFAALEYSTPGKIDYAYFMEGWDRGWNAAGKMRTATYTKLGDGNYRLRIRSTNTDGVWETTEKILFITILPPWYRSWWAYSLYFFIALLVGYLFVRYQRHQSFLKYQVELANLRVNQERELNENKLTFFTNISHEFRTPLTLIINPIKEFLNSKDSHVDPKELIIVYRNARRLLSLVDQLLSFRKSETQNIKASRFNFIAFSKDIFTAFSHQAKSKQITYLFLTDEEESYVFGDREKLEIVLFNLLANAFKFTPNGGNITLKIQSEKCQLVVKVIDSGSGVSEAAGAKIFERFYQDGKQHASGGFGIGLFLVKKLIDAHHGQVGYHSVTGEGTEFKFSLLLGTMHFKTEEIVEDLPSTFTMEAPMESFAKDPNDIDQFMEEGTSTKKSNFDPTTDKKAILIVEDNADIRTYIKKIFIDDYLIYEADNGTEGFKLVKKYVPDMVITDVVMDGGNGLDLCSKIKSNPELSHIPVIILTSSSSSEIKLKGIEQGADDFITKPFDQNILMARVVNLLKSRNALQQYFLNEITLKSDDFKISSEYKEFLERCIAITENHLDNPDFGVKTLADELATSPSLLYKKVKSISGKTTNEFIRYIRLRKAAQLLIDSDYNINQTAIHCGFNDVRYFREQFNKVFGMRPSDYIKKYRISLSARHRVIRDF
ncbi:MAG: hybrid sensor histidine kinase/response regulator [Pedobacter sp.]|nr:MAG: hybrid sensor histidine kinase/response regulator [Pedobacter sp.]